MQRLWKLLLPTFEAFTQSPLSKVRTMDTRSKQVLV